MSKRKKIFLSVVVVLSMVISGNTSIFAVTSVSDNLFEIRENVKQEQIDSIFNELNKLAAERANTEYLLSNGIDVYSLKDQEATVDVKKKEELQRERKNELEDELAELGVRKIDASKIEDIRLLNEMECSMHEAVLNRSEGYSLAPDLSAIANMYTLYIYDGTRKYNGVTYNYRYIKVIDDKEYGGLTKIEEADPIKTVPSGTLVGDLVKYNLNYIFSEVLDFVGAAVVDWIIGNAFTALNHTPSGVITTTGKSLYRVIHTSVTSMTYYFIENDSWRLIGVGASAQTIRSEHISMNVNGSPYVETHTEQFTAKTPGIWYDYLDYYFNNMSWNPSACLVNEIGNFKFVAKDKNGLVLGIVNFAPAYARYPMDLI